MNFNNIRKEIEQFRKALSNFIGSLPDGNEGVEFLDKKKKCAVVNFSTIQKNKGILCPGYYLNHTAKDEMKRILEKTRLESLDNVIEKIVQTGNIPTSSGQMLKANPEFITKLKLMWESALNGNVGDDNAKDD